MYHNCPEACFVYERKGRIIGVTLNRVEGNELYMRQIFVREGNRERGIGTVLYERGLQFAKDQDLKQAKANIRRETRRFHKKYNPEICGEPEFYIMRR